MVVYAEDDVKPVLLLNFLNVNVVERHFKVNIARFRILDIIGIKRMSELSQINAFRADNVYQAALFIDVNHDRQVRFPYGSFIGMERYVISRNIGRAAQVIHFDILIGNDGNITRIYG